MAKNATFEHTVQVGPEAQNVLTIGMEVKDGQVVQFTIGNHIIPAPFFVRLSNAYTELRQIAAKNGYSLPTDQV